MLARRTWIKGMCVAAGLLSPVAFAATYSTIIPARGHWGGTDALQVIAQGTDGYAYVPVWQDSAGNWNAGASLPGQTATVSSLTASRGYGNYLNVVGIRTADSQPQLVGYQDSTGAWQTGGGLPSDGTALRQVVAATGQCASAPLQVIGLGTDDYPRVIAYQDNAGTWHASGQVLETTYKLLSISVGYGNQGNLQVYGVVNDPAHPSAGMFAGFQDHSSCTWTGGAGLLNVYFEYRSLVQVNGNDGNLQVLGLPISIAPPFSRTSFAPYLATWQDSDGNWSPGPPGPIASNFTPVLTSFAGAQGNSGNLQIWGLGADALPHMVAWQNQSGTWSNVGSLPQFNAPLTTLIMGNGNGGNVQVIGLGTNNHIELISVQDGGGNWSAGEDLTTLVNGTGGGGGGGVGGGGCPRC